MMDVHIEELHSSVQVVDPTTLLSPQVLAVVVDAVLRRLEEQRTQDRRRSRSMEGRLTRRRSSTPRVIEVRPYSPVLLVPGWSAAFRLIRIPVVHFQA